MWILFVFSLYSFVLYIVCYVVLSCLCICIYLYMEMETESCAVCYVTLYCLFMKWQIKIDNIAVFMCALKPNAKRSILFENMKNLIKKIIKKASLFLLLHPIREKKIQKAWTKNLVYERSFWYSLVDVARPDTRGKYYLIYAVFYILFGKQWSGWYRREAISCCISKYSSC